MDKSVFNAFPNHLNIITNLQILMLFKIFESPYRKLKLPTKTLHPITPISQKRKKNRNKDSQMPTQKLPTHLF